ncbi:Gfo/Idh/MocA family protein [Listeria goaensis]|uniref:Gfo/Idh/MocA family protein n=1 Tax=Listeria goaensis TaxID=1649188 RepID=UPI000B596877|nr:Gfo/Idh/MocA family oxidoreductase [Listeria goaensis]
MKKRVAIIGAGQVAETVHADYYKTRPELILAAVCDPNLKRAEEFAEQNGFLAAYSDAKSLFLNEKVDMVSICTPNRFHFENVMLALQNGAHVMCEKPPAMTPEEALAMAEEAASRGLVLAYDFHHRFSDEARFLKQEKKLFGDIYIARARALRRSGVPGWGTFTNKEIQGGGPLIDIGIHMLDTAMYVLDFPEVKRVMAKSFQKIGTKKRTGSFGSWDPEKFTVEDALLGWIEFADGSVLELETSFALHMKEERIFDVAFFGDRAGGTLYPAEIYTDTDGELEMLREPRFNQKDSHPESMAAFVEKVLSGTGEVASGEQGYVIQRLVAALYESAEKEECVYL